MRRRTGDGHGLSDCPPLPQARLRAVDRALRGLYGDPGPQRLGDPLDGLIRTILSQNTTAANSRAAYASLRARFPTWEACARAPVRAIARAIESGGLANVKAARIREILRHIERERGALNLDFLQSLPPSDAAPYLRQFPGVGPKTAACVLLFDCAQPVFPVDTHVWRVAKRLGWLAPTCGREEAHAILQAVVPPDLAYSLHLNLVAHGRRLCRPARPRCGECPPRRYCKYYAENREHRGQSRTE